MSNRDAVIRDLELAATALERAAAHCRAAAEYLQHGDAPKMGVHAFAAHGDARRGLDALGCAAMAHAATSRVAGDD
ncbi:hypothetical protein ACQEVB_03355 [Pseudonocardia sp. CA-107938]|uniref:hypothetical protein n=1 Tax=Pseudonocardia sp. CA-107938 TaxID=3240021 RepID=UPI003D92B469